MKKFLFLLLFGVLVFGSAQAQDRGSNLSFAPAKESKKAKRETYKPKDRSYWQNDRNLRKLRKKGKKKCDCPSQMTEKQRRRYRFRN